MMTKLPPVSKAHTMRKFDEELVRLHFMVLEMGEATKKNFALCLKILSNALAPLSKEECRKLDQKIIRKEGRISDFAIKLLALRHPIAIDLRFIITCQQISLDLERISNYTRKILSRQNKMFPLPEQSISDYLQDVHQAGQEAFQLLEESLQTYEKQTQKATDMLQKTTALLDRDHDLDKHYRKFSKTLMSAIEQDAQLFPTGLHLLFIVKYIERIGDLSCNISRSIYYALTGDYLTS